MLERDRKGFNALRIFAIFALCCTVVLWAGLWIASATPADKSGQDTQAVTDKLDSKYNLNYKFNQKVVTQHIAFDEDTTYSGYYAGETLKTELVFMPKNTLDKAVRYESSDTSVATVSEDGVITFLSRGESKISVYLVSNPEVYNYVGVTCFGENPKTSGLTLALDASLKVGTTTMVSLNEDRIAPRGAKYKSSDESVLKVDKQGYVSGISEGNATLTATVKGVSASINVTVSQNPEYIKPERINLKQNVTLTHGYKMDAYNLIDSVYPQGAPKDCVVNTSSSSLGVVYKDLAPRSPGTYTVTFTSRYDESVTASVEVAVVKVSPTELRVSGPAVTTPNSKTKFTAKHMPQYYEDDVTWEIVSGKGSISSDGVFVNEGFGTTVIRCRSTLDPTLYVDKTVESKLFSDAYSMVRKIYGARRTVRTSRIRHIRHAVASFKAQIQRTDFHRSARLYIRRLFRTHSEIHPRQILHDSGRSHRLHRHAHWHDDCNNTRCYRMRYMAACKQEKFQKHAVRVAFAHPLVRLQKDIRSGRIRSSRRTP